jgi:hypothetical protein
LVLTTLFSKPGVVEDMAECFLANLPLADAVVAVHPRAEIGLGVVQMEGHNLLQPDQRSGLTDTLANIGRWLPHLAAGMLEFAAAVCAPI